MITIRKVKYALLTTMGIVFILTAVSPVALAQPAEDMGGGGVDDCSQSFLSLPTWYRGLLTTDCEIMSPTEVGGIGPFIWKIVLNIVEMILRLAGYAAVVFIIYGGYKYMISAGSPDGMVAARKTIMNAVIGLVISVAAIAIVRTVSNGLGVG